MSASDEKYQFLQQLPQFPAIATKVLRALSNEDPQIEEIERLVRADASLSSEVLRIVNSPLYGLSSQVSSIKQALLLLGFEEVKRFVLAVSMKSFLRPALRMDLLRKIWRHCLACAIVCEDLSAACSTAGFRDDRAYTTGLLHDIGRLGLFVAHPQEYAALLGAPDRSMPILEQERRLLGVDHCDAGSWLAKTWGLPEEIRLVAGGHHQPLSSANWNLENLVRVGVLLTDSLGFDIVVPENVFTLGEIRSMLPMSAALRFDPSVEALKAKIATKLDAFD
jgi:HD-like signal output (HDOD) protein